MIHPLTRGHRAEATGASSDCLAIKAESATEEVEGREGRGPPAGWRVTGLRTRTRVAGRRAPVRLEATPVDGRLTVEGCPSVGLRFVLGVMEGERVREEASGWGV